MQTGEYLGKFVKRLYRSTLHKPCTKLRRRTQISRMVFGAYYMHVYLGICLLSFMDEQNLTNMELRHFILRNICNQSFSIVLENERVVTISLGRIPVADKLEIAPAYPIWLFWYDINCLSNCSRDRKCIVLPASGCSVNFPSFRAKMLGKEITKLFAQYHPRPR